MIEPIKSATDWAAVARSLAAKDWPAARLRAWWSASAAYDAEGEAAQSPFNVHTESALAFEWARYFEIKAEAMAARRRRNEATNAPEPGKAKPIPRPVHTHSPAFADLGGATLSPEP